LWLLWVGVVLRFEKTKRKPGGAGAGPHDDDDDDDDNNNAEWKRRSLFCARWSGAAGRGGAAGNLSRREE
jgi:hypothetical protein